MKATRERLAKSDAPPTGWQIGKPHRNAIAYDFVCSRWMDNLLVAQENAAPLRQTFNGSDVLIFGEQTKKSGSYSVRIDDGEARTYSAKCAAGNMRLVQVVAEGLDPEKTHTIEITPILRPGEELRIESICIADGRNSQKD